jgi:RNA polymerase sigma factor (sigma-70 family)
VRGNSSGGSTISDEALVAGIAVGDERAGVAFVRRYQTRVYGLALTMVGDPALAQDITQEAFIRVWRHGSMFDRRRASVSTWVRTITRNLAVDSLRVRRPELVDPADSMWANLASGCPLPDEEAESSDTRARLSPALATLPAEQSRALVLAAIYGYTAAEIGRFEAIPLGTAKTRIRRGLIKLRAFASTHDLASHGARP